MLASVKRWTARDSVGQSMLTVLDEIKPDGDKGFAIKLKEPFPLLIDGLAKVSSLAPFMMPERLAKTDPFKQVTEMVGSGPFKFVKDEYQPGNKDVVRQKRRLCAAQGAAELGLGRQGGQGRPRRVAVRPGRDDGRRRRSTAGEADWWENPPLELVPVLGGQSDIVIAPADPIGAR